MALNVILVTSFTSSTLIQHSGGIFSLIAYWSSRGPLLTHLTHQCEISWPPLCAVQQLLICKSETDASVQNKNTILGVILKKWFWEVVLFLFFFPSCPPVWLIYLFSQPQGWWISNHPPRGKLFTLRRTSGGLSWCYRFLWSLCYPFEHILSSHLCTRLQTEQHTGAALEWISNRKVPEPLVKHT